MEIFDQYTQAFEAMAHDADCLYGEMLIRNFVAMEVTGSFDLKTTIQKYWNKLLELIDRFRRFIADKFRAAREAIRKLISVIRRRDDSDDEYDSSLDEVLTNMDKEIDNITDNITELIRLSDEIRAAGGNPDDDERVKAIIDQMTERTNELLKKSEDNLKTVMGMESHLAVDNFNSAMEASFDDDDENPGVGERTWAKLKFIRKAMAGEYTPEQAKATLDRMEEEFGDLTFLPGKVTRKPRPWTREDLNDLRLEAAAGANSKEFFMYMAEMGYEVNRKQRIVRNIKRGIKTKVDSVLKKAEALLKSIERCTEGYHKVTEAFKRKFNGERRSDQTVASKLQGIINRILGFLSRVGKGIASIPGKILRKVRGDNAKEERI